jgi:hypothetical protein
MQLVVPESRKGLWLPWTSTATERTTAGNGMPIDVVGSARNQSLQYLQLHRRSNTMLNPYITTKNALVPYLHGMKVGQMQMLRDETVQAEAETDLANPRAEFARKFGK